MPVTPSAADGDSQAGGRSRAPGPARAMLRTMAASTSSGLGDFIRRQRELHDVSMRQLARMAGISNPYLSQIEHGLREPSRQVLEGIARSLELSADTLYEQAGLAHDAAKQPPAVVEAIRADERLTARQRQALIEVYHAFAAGNDAGRSRRRPRSRHGGSSRRA
jgi:transcriptional regulator with XRE-family HTH domain